VGGVCRVFQILIITLLRGKEEAAGLSSYNLITIHTIKSRFRGTFGAVLVH